MRLVGLYHLTYANEVSIHAPREGCDYTYDAGDQEARRFQFTHPGRGATQIYKTRAHVNEVSIHAPREGCDMITITGQHILTFQFTHPGRGATIVHYSLNGIASVSIHAPREGCDRKYKRTSSNWSVFQFTHPGRGATFERTTTLR